MRSMFVALAVACLIFPARLALGVDHATKEEAVAMVDKAVRYVQENGTAKAYAAFDDRNGSFVDRDLYIFVYDLNGKCLANGAIPKLIGMDLRDAQDVNGEYYVRDRIEAAKTKDSFWIDNYTFQDPVTRKLEPKLTYCRKLDDSLICAGVYKLSN